MRNVFTDFINYISTKTKVSLDSDNKIITGSSKIESFIRSEITRFVHDYSHDESHVDLIRNALNSYTFKTKLGV